jgi:uncharacterized membrane protein
MKTVAAETFLLTSIFLALVIAVLVVMMFMLKNFMIKERNFLLEKISEVKSESAEIKRLIVGEVSDVFSHIKNIIK